MLNEQFLQKQIAELQAELEIKNYIIHRTIQLATKEGFIKAYYELCSTCKTNVEAFNKISEEYESIFGIEPPYSCWNSFRNVLARKYGNV